MIALLFRQPRLISLRRQSARNDFEHAMLNNLSMMAAPVMPPRLFGRVPVVAIDIFQIMLVAPRFVMVVTVAIRIARISVMIIDLGAIMIAIAFIIALTIIRMPVAVVRPCFRRLCCKSHEHRGCAQQNLVHFALLDSRPLIGNVVL